MSDMRRALLERIHADRDRIIRFLQDFTRIDTSNPPGDTRAGAVFIESLLGAAGLPYRRIAPREAMPNILASTRFARPGRHLVLNGHIDVFPSGDRAQWTRDPLSGDLVDGRVHGRGTVDMKCGTTASIFTYVYLSQLADQLRGALTLTLVSDEETGGRWGSGYLVERHTNEVLGDYVLQDNVQALLGFRPPAIVSLGGTDCRFWRAAGVPAYVYGCSPSGMGAPDESGRGRRSPARGQDAHPLGLRLPEPGSGANDMRVGLTLWGFGIGVRASVDLAVLAEERGFGERVHGRGRDEQ